MWGRLCRRPAEVPFDGGRPWEPWRFECRRAAENVALKEQWAVFFFLFSGFRLSTRHSKERENVKVMFLQTDVVGCLRLSTLSLVIIFQCWDGGEALLSICICFVLYARCKKVHCEIIKLNTREGMFVRVYIFVFLFRPRDVFDRAEPVLSTSKHLHFSDDYSKNHKRWMCL